MKPDVIWDRLSAHLDLDIDAGQIELLERYELWLLDEAIPAGGLGPNEGPRLRERHIVDSLLFATVFPPDPKTLIDVGSGVGLPGIPLAILFPDARVTLVERSGRRADLLKRALRVLDLSNVEIAPVDIRRYDGTSPLLVSRAAIPPEDMADLGVRLVEPGGLLVLGGSWERRPTAAGWLIQEIPARVLDHAVWLLIMRRQ